MINLSYAFTILLITLGPVKVIPVFYLLSHDAEPAYRRGLAVRGFIVSSALVAFILLAASATRESWGVSVDALIIAGGIILFVTALRTILNFDIIDVAPAETAEMPVARPPLTWQGKPVAMPLVVPTIVTPGAIVALLFYLGRSAENADFRVAFLLIVAGILLANLVAMLAARPIMRVVGLPMLQILGWVFASLQAGLAVQVIVTALRNMAIIP
jgi:multiple antibiotic resistance protein